MSAPPFAIEVHWKPSNGQYEIWRSTKYPGLYSEKETEEIIETGLKLNIDYRPVSLSAPYLSEYIAADSQGVEHSFTIYAINEYEATVTMVEILVRRPELSLLKRSVAEQLAEGNWHAQFGDTKTPCQILEEENV